MEPLRKSCFSRSLRNALKHLSSDELLERPEALNDVRIRSNNLSCVHKLRWVNVGCLLDEGAHSGGQQIQDPWAY